MMEFIQSPQLPPPAGHYSPAVRAGGFVFVSGVLPGTDVSGFEPQVRDALERCRLVLQAAACDLHQVVHDDVAHGADRVVEVAAILDAERKTGSEVFFFSAGDIFTGDPAAA